MTEKQLRTLDRELAAYLERMVEGMGRPERRSAMSQYVTGLLLDGDRKSIQPMAKRLARDPSDAESLRQRLQECVVISPWSDQVMMGRLGAILDAELPNVEAFVFDDTGFPKKGTHSVGVARQYSGTLGRVDNCQIAVSLHLAGQRGSGCIAMRMYLTEQWAEDTKRRNAVGVPLDVRFQPKWDLALDQLDTALASGIRRHPVLADAGYGDATEFRSGIATRGLHYVVGVSSVPTIWRPGVIPSVTRRHATGPHPTRPRAAEHPVSLSTFVQEIPATRFRSVTWRDGSRGKMSGRFYAVRVYSAERHTKKERPQTEPIWLVIERTGEAKRPFKFFFSNLPESASLKRLVALIKLRWRVERDYQEMKQELGLDHFEGRTWRGFHHHATLCAIAHGFLALRRALSPPILPTVDLAAGAPLSPDLAHTPHRPLPAVPHLHRPQNRSKRTLENVIR